MFLGVLALFVLCAIVVFVVSACVGLGNTPTGIGKQPGTGRGIISNLDPLNNGLNQVWFLTDNTYVYCTNDQILIEKIQKIITLPGDTTVNYTYRDWKVGDTEFDNFDAWGDRISATCGQFVKGSSGSKLLTVDLVVPRPQ